MEYRREIDGLRAVAVLAVILFHAGFGGFAGGFVGVDVFFVISGYLITSIILAERREGRFTLAGFYERRARRILPALFLVMAACLPFAWAWMLPVDLAGFADSLMAVAAFSSNILFWRETGYFGSDTGLVPLLHTWSLSVEEQYYLLLPLFLLLTARFGRGWQVLALAAIAAISLALAEWGALNTPWAAFFLLPTRGWELLVGVLVAFHLLGPGEDGAGRGPSRAGHELLAGAGLALIAGAVLLFDWTVPVPGLHALVPTLGAALVIVFARPDTLAGRLLGSKWLVAIGLVSYSAYLWHQPLFAFARYRLIDEPGMGLRLGLAAASFALAWPSWRFVERPFRDRRFSTRRGIFAMSLAGLLGVLAIGAVGAASDGFAGLRSSPVVESLSATAQPSPMRRRCHDRRLAPQREACAYFGEDVSWAVVGDSHASPLAYALALRLEKAGQGLRQYSQSACAPSFGSGGADECSRWTRVVFDDLLARPEIGTVVLSYRLNYHLFGGHEHVYPAQPHEGTDARRAAILARLADAAGTLRRAGRHVIVVLQAPELPKPLAKLIFAAGEKGAGNIAGVSREWWDARAALGRQWAAALGPAIDVIDPASLFCDEALCAAARDGVSFYFDDDHLSVSGAGLVASRILAGTEMARLAD